MQNPIIQLPKEKEKYLRYLFLLASILLVVYFIPKKGRFKYEFEESKPWRHEDLIAPISFAIQKSDTELKEEKKAVADNLKPFYQRLDNVPELSKQEFIKEFNNLSSAEDFSGMLDKKYYVSRGLQMLDEVYEKGLIQLDTAHQYKGKDFSIIELKNNVASERLIGNYLRMNEAKNSFLERVQRDSSLNKSWFLKPMFEALRYNIIYDSSLTSKKLQSLLSSISPTRGMVAEGEKIISRGNIVTHERYQVLMSLRAEYETHRRQDYMLIFGYFLLITVLFIMYTMNLQFFQIDVSSRNRGMILILINVLLFTGITAYVVQHESLNIYLIPYCIVPIILLAFFGIRAALLTHLLVVLICGLMVPNPYEFVLLQTLAGFTAILSMARIRYISQFFVSAMLILLTYGLVFMGLNLVKTNNLSEINWIEFSWFGGNFILTLLAYPLIYVNEKIFGFLSDISLLELADINNKVLKELFLRAPGTFQHSLQVANLSEAVIDRIGGNALLTRVGALYHDIGKLENPDYFIENQKFSYNPHEKLTDLESAEIIIGHVTKGVEIAQENHIPKRVIDFIRSHHGTTRVEYFYKHYVQDHKDEEVDESIFRYPGPKPASKETAVVMMVDSIEAASRSLKNPDDKQIDVLVDRIIDNKIQDKQFDYATITIHEINTTRRIIKKLVKSIYHIRIEYPTDKEDNKIN